MITLAGFEISNFRLVIIKNFIDENNKNGVYQIIYTKYVVIEELSLDRKKSRRFAPKGLNPHNLTICRKPPETFTQ